MNNGRTVGSARSVGFLLAAVGAALLLVIGYGRIIQPDAAAYPAEVTLPDNTGPAHFLPAPAPEPVCASQAYFSSWDLNQAVADGTAPRQTVYTDQARTDDGEQGVTATFTTTQLGPFGDLVSPEVFSGAGNSIGIVMYEPAAATVSMSEPLFYSQWVFTDLDQNLEGFEVRPLWSAGTGELGIFFPTAEWNSAGSSNTVADFNTLQSGNTQGYDLRGRAQVDFWGPITSFSVLRTGAGGSGFAGGAGCPPLGLAKTATEPIYDAAANTFTADYTIDVINNLPSTATLATKIAAAQGTAGSSFISGQPEGIPITGLQINDTLELTGFSSATVSNLASDVLTVNPAYDGVNDTALLAGSDTLEPEMTAKVTFTVTYVPDFASKTWDSCQAGILNQAFGSGTALDISVADESDFGTDPNPASVNEVGTGPDDPTPVTFSLTCAIDLTKDVTAGPVNNGDGTYDLEYTLVATNTGTAPLTNVVIDDDLFNTFGSDLTSSTLKSDTCADVTLKTTETCTKVFDLVISPTSTFTWTNTGTVTAIAPGGDSVTAEDDANTAVTEAPAITLTKEVTAGPVSNGDGNYTADYTLTAQNTGSTVLNNVVVTDGLEAVFGDALVSSTVKSDSCVRSTLNASVPAGSGDTCQVVLTVVFMPGTNLGPYTNIATVTAVSPGGVQVTATDDASVTAPPQNPAIDLVKTAATGDLAVGVVVGYTFEVTNTGDVVLNNVKLVDDLLENETCPKTTLAVGEKMTCTGTYTITQADVDAGNVDNTAVVTGVSPDGQEVTDTDSVTYPLDQSPDISLVKDAEVFDTNGDGLNNAGDIVNYTFTVTNIGNITLTEVKLVDDLIDDETCPTTTLAPGESMVCTGTYVITPADVIAGKVDNTAVVSSKEGKEVTDKETVDTEESPAIDLVKTATTGELEVGVIVEYTFDVTNTGDVPLSNVVLVDDLLTDVTCPLTELAVGETMMCTGTYTITQADVDAGTVVNIADVTGTSPGGENVTDTDSVNYPLEKTPGLVVDKMDAAGTAIAGNQITYPITVTNTGNVTLTSLKVVDSLTADVTCDTDTLAPGETANCVAIYTVTQADVDACQIINVVNVAAADPEGMTVSGEDSVTTPVSCVPGISVVKSIIDLTIVKVGDTVPYEIVVTNTGTTTLTSVTIDDGLTDDEVCPRDTLAPGESMTCTATYVVTQADVDAGEVTNVVTATGVDPKGQTVSDQDDETIPAERKPDLKLDKQTPTGDLWPGSTLTYPLVVTNNGTVTLTNVVVTDSLSTNVVCEKTVLAPGESMNCTATYVVTMNDMMVGQITNTATVNGTDPEGNILTDQDTEVVDLPKPAKPTPPPMKPTPVPPMPKPTLPPPPPKPKPPLAYTGAQPVPMALSGIGLILFGLTLAGANPRRKKG